MYTKKKKSWPALVSKFGECIKNQLSLYLDFLYIIYVTRKSYFNNLSIYTDSNKF